MSIGKITRKLLGKYFDPVGKIYRAFFVNVDIFVSSLPVFEKGQDLIDIGGGDGEILDKILTQNPHIKAILIDISSNVGRMISNTNLKRIKLLPGYSIKKYINSSKFSTAKYLMLSDVLHHIPPNNRKAFFEDIFSLCNKNTTLIIKDIEPGFFKSILSLLADKYISGDKQTSLISQENVTEEIKKKYPEIKIQKTTLFKKNPPNYCLVFRNFV